MLEQIWTVFSKEVLDNLRDRRSLSLALFYPFVGPVIVGLLVGLVGRTISELPRDGFVLPVHGAHNAPNLVAYLEGNGARVVPATRNPQAAVRNGEHDAVLVVPEAYSEHFSGKRPATVQIVSDPSRLSAMLAVSRTLSVLRAYNEDIVAARLRAHGIDPLVAEPVNVETINVSVGHSLTGFFLNMMPPFIIFTIFVGGVYLAIDTVSGERERGSLEPLLTMPVARSELLMGKVWAAVVFTATAVLVQLIAFNGMFELITRDGAMLDVSPSSISFGLVFVIAVPLMLFAVALQMIIATATRSFKETQTLGLLPLVPSLPGLVLVFISIKAHKWMMAIPTFGQTVLMGQLVRGEAVEPTYVVVASSVTAAAAFALLAVATRLYRREALVSSS